VPAVGTLSARNAGGGGGDVRSGSPSPRRRRHRRPLQTPRARLRRAADAAGAALLLALLAPSLLVVALLLRAQAGGGGGSTVLARRVAVGRGGGEFALLTFRAEPATLLGRLLDASGVAALPMLLNVLRGEMALVGPAPMTRAELAVRGVDPTSIGRPGMIVG
jgi:lipopolysaccharide/colanic/teichoic acid biosynthesis glycosyltransferase